MSKSQRRESWGDVRIVLSSEGEACRVTISELGNETPLATATVPAPELPRLPLAALRHGESLSPEALEAFGRTLAGILLPPPILEALLRRRKKGSVRIRVQADPPFDGLPWEFAHVESGYLGLQPGLCLVREAAPKPSAPPPGQERGAARRVLVVSANPGSARYPSLPAVDSEAQGVRNALQARECRELEVDALPYATPAGFFRQLQGRPVDILHFIGHGDRLASGGVLVFEGGRQGEDERVYADEIAPALLRARVRLVVLSSCFSAAGGGIAGHLVEEGVPTVVAMQFPWDDQAARLFARAFYGALAEGEPVEEALLQGRIAIRGCGADWGVPVLTVSSVPTAPEAAPLVAPGPKVLHNLPKEDWPFVGRATELRNLRRAVITQRRGLVTITGTGGMGKTRLARRFAEQVVPEFPDGVWLVDCEPLASEEDLRDALAVVPGLEGATHDWEAICEAIGDRGMLLVLDCFERLVPHARSLMPLLNHGPNLQVLVTSRRLLGLAREHEIAVPPLSLTKRAGGKADGTELFRTAASYADPEVGKSDEDRAVIEALVRDLEAVPLAIVLAARRLRHLSLAELQKRLESHLFEVLGGEGEASERHADYSQVIRASLDLLSPQDRDLAERLCVFHGGFYHDDAVAVLGAETDLFEGISALRDNSILISQTVGNQKRFRILDAIREYVEKKSAPVERMAEIRQHHAEYFSQRAAEIRRTSERGDWHKANLALRNDAANFRAAIRHAVTTRSKALIRSFALSLARTYLEAGARPDFDYLTIAANHHAEVDGDRRLRMELAGLEGALHRRERDFTQARNVWLTRVRLAEEEGDFDTVADSLLDIADMSLERNELAVVEALLLRVEGLGTKVASAPLRASAALLGAKLALRRDQPDRALELARNAYEMVADVDGDPLAMYVWISLGQVFLAVRALPESKRMCRRMIQESMRCGYVHYTGRALLALSATREEEGRLEDAALAAAIAAVIPRTASLSLRAEAVQRLRSLSDRHGVKLTRAAVEQAKLAPWGDLAQAIIEGLDE